MPPKIWRRTFPAGYGVEKALAAIRAVAPEPDYIETPPEMLEDLVQTGVGGEGFTLSSFTAQDAMELGHLLYSRLLPIATEEGTPALISISCAGGAQVCFQIATGPGLTPNNESMVRRMRAAVLRFGVSSWYLGCKYDGDEGLFAEESALSPDEAREYALEGGAVPIRVEGAEGIVGVVVVNGLRATENHEVIAEAIRDNWE